MSCATDLYFAQLGIQKWDQWAVDGLFERGKEIHSKLSQSANAKEFGVEVSNALIAMFAHFSDVDAAEKVFESVSAQRRGAVILGAIMHCFAKEPHQRGYI